MGRRSAFARGAARPWLSDEGLRQRAFGKNGLLVVEGANAGRFDIIELNGDNAEVKTVKSGFKQPVARSGRLEIRPGCWKANWRRCSIP